MELVALKTENKVMPIAIDTPKPVFEWNIRSGAEGVKQTWYRIRVYQDAPGENPYETSLWDSGIVRSDRMVNIAYAGDPLQSDTRYLWKVIVGVSYMDKGTKQAKQEVLAGWTFFETAYLDEKEWTGTFIGETEDQVYHLYRRHFSVEGPLVRAKLYICGLGHFLFYLNGKQMTDHVLETPWSDYHKTCYYTAFDLTPSLKKGENQLLVRLGDGMFHVPGGRYVYYPRSYGRSKFLAQLVLEYENGTTTCICTDEKWEMTPGPVQFCCIYGGEDFDGRLWDASVWETGEKGKKWYPAKVVDWPKGHLKASPIESLRVMEEYGPIAVEETSPGVWLFDFGKNFSGWARIRLHTNGKQAGRKVVITPGEILDKNRCPDQKVTGAGYQWTYILNEETEQEFAPDFTYTGFRYAQVEGAVPSGKGNGDDNPELLWIKGEFIYPDVEKGGEFSCENGLFQDIHQIVLQAIKSNMKSYFTDCPHREKLPWLEQTHLIGPSIMYNFDVQNLYGKILQDMEDAQRENGLIPDICPEYVTGFDKWHKGFLDSPEWGSACILGAWYAYIRYGSRSILERYYTVMQRYIGYLMEKTHHEILHHGLGDWLDIGPCTPHSQNTPVPVVATCVFYMDLCIMEKIAWLLDKTEDEVAYRQKKEAVFKEYNLQFLDDQTARYANGSQAAQAMSLMAGLVPQDFLDKAVRELRLDVEKRNYAITAGDIGHPYLIGAMMEHQMNDLLEKMTLITDTPGYGYQVKHGATTLTEEWDGPEPGNPHGSQNHLMLGSIEEWFYGALGGLPLIREGLPLNEAVIRPFVAKETDWVKVWIRHPYGRLESEWEKEGEEVAFSFRIPPNVTASIYLPGEKTPRVVGSGRYQWRVKNIQEAE